MKLLANQPWLRSPSLETFLILLPPVAPIFLLLAFPNYFHTHGFVSNGWWIVLVMGIDVSHVYSTTFRFYWEPQLFAQYKRHLIITPIAAFLVGWFLHSIDALVFWRVMAYVAVFHFIRQQYGFMRLYSRKTKSTSAERTIDSLAIYTATIYPIVYWHLHKTGELNWFVEGDFIDLSFLSSAVFDYAYFAVIFLYLVKEIMTTWLNKNFNIPKNAIVVGTFLSWYVGIVLAENDLTFTMLNVVAHGVPYMALIWIYGTKSRKTTWQFPVKEVAFFIITLLAFAYLEEGIWDVLIWKDHPGVFPFLQDIPRPDLWLVSIIVPLLSLPQITHYVMDGFIWKRSGPNQ